LTCCFKRRKKKGGGFIYFNKSVPFCSGKDVCGFCKGDIAAAAERAELKSLTVSAIDDNTGLPKTITGSQV
jgi:hypothetical protein